MLLLREVKLLKGLFCISYKKTKHNSLNLKKFEFACLETLQTLTFNLYVILFYKIGFLLNYQLNTYCTNIHKHKYENKYI